MRGTPLSRCVGARDGDRGRRPARPGAAGQAFPRDLAMRRSLTAAALVAALAAPAAAQVISAEKGKKLIEQCLAALGGTAFLKMRDRVQFGRAYQFSRERLRGLAVMTVFTKYDFPPSPPIPGWIGVRERREVGRDGDYGFLFADGKGYEITFRGARPLPADYMQQYHDRLRRDIFYVLKYRMEEPGMVFESVGSEIIDNQPVDAVRVTDGDNRSFTVHLLQSSRLPLRQQYVRRDPKTRETIREEANYTKYRNFGGVQLPLNVLQVRDDEKIFEMFSETIEINKGVDESVFSLKKGTKVLPEDK